MRQKVYELMKNNNYKKWIALQTVHLILFAYTFKQGSNN